MRFISRIKAFKPLESPASFSIISLGEKLIPLVLLPVFLNDIGVEDYGMLFLFVTLNNIISPIINCGFSAFFVSKYYKFPHAKRVAVFGNYLIVQLVVILVMTLLLSVITIFVKPWSLSFIELWIFMVLTPFALNLFNIVKEVYQIKIAILVYIFLVLAAIILEIGLSIYFLKGLELGWPSRIYAMVGTYIFISITGLVLLRNEIKIKFYDKTIIKEWLKFGVPLIIHRISGLALGLGDRLIIDAILGHYFLGIYTVAQQVSAPILMLANAIKSAWNPWFYKSSSDESFRKVKTGLVKKIFLLALICWGLFILLLPLVYDHVIHDIPFERIKAFVYLISLGYLFQALYFLEVPNLMVRDMTKILAKITFVSGLVVIFGNVALTGLYGIMASSIVFLIAWLIQFFSVRNIVLGIERRNPD